MVSRFLTLLFIILLFFTSCTTKYRIGNISSQSVLDPKPIYKENGKEKATYIGGNYSKMIREYNLGPSPKANSIDLLEAQISRGTCGENSFSSFGGFTYAGLYDAIPLDPNDITSPVRAGKKWFVGGGIDYEFGHKVSLKDAEIRTIGLKTNLYYENGSYATFRRNAENASVIDPDVFFDNEDGIRIEDANPLGIGFNLLATHEFIFLLENGTLSIALVYGFGAGAITSSLGLGFSRGPVHFGLNTHANVDGSFVNASIRYQLPK